MLSETSSRLHTMKNDSLYHKLLNDVKDDLITSSISLLSKSEGLCILSNTSNTYYHSTSPPSHTNAINDTKNQGNFMQQLAWEFIPLVDLTLTNPFPNTWAAPFLYSQTSQPNLKT